jgi:hypothetical protein
LHVIDNGPVLGTAGVPATHDGACPKDTVNDIKPSEIKRNSFLTFSNKSLFIVKGIDATMSGLFRLPTIIQHRGVGSGAKSLSLMGKNVFYRHPVAGLDINGWVTELLLQSGAFPRTSEDYLKRGAR